MGSRGPKGRAADHREVFVGRQKELTLIVRLLDGTKEGHASFLGLSGEPGIGKTRLAEAAAAAARGKGFATFWGQCHDGQYIPPYWPWKEPLRGLLKITPGHTALKRGRGGVFSDAFKAPSAKNEMPRPVAERTRVRILESATSVIFGASGRKPILLVMDNLHCADVPSLQLLAVIAREMRGRKVMIIGSYREPAADSTAEFRATISALAGQEFFHGLPLSGWELAAVSEYLQACGVRQPPMTLVRALLERTEGNPLFVEEVARSLKSEGLLNNGSSAGGPGWEKHIPQKVRLAILGQVERLSVPCRDVMSMAALAGREFESTVLRQATQMTRRAIDLALEEAIANGIVLDVNEKPGLYKFAHALVQDVVVDQIPAPRRSSLHLKMGRVLELRSVDDLESRAGELARHFDRAGPEAVSKAAHYYRLAGERALRLHGFEDAMGQFERALHLRGSEASDHDTARLLFALAQAQHGAGIAVEAVATFTRAFDLFEQSGDPDNAVHILEQPLFLAEKGAHSTGLLERAIGLAGPGSLRAEALGGKYGLAVYHETGDYQKAAALFDRALISARKSGDRQQEATALTNRGRIEFDELHFEESHRLEQQALLIAREIGDYWLEGMSSASGFLALLGLGRLADAEKQTQSLKDLAERVHARIWSVVIGRNCAAVLRQDGELAAARETNEKALALGPGPYRIWNCIDRALLEYELGNAALGADYLRQVIENEVSGDEMAFNWEGELAVLTSLITWLTDAPVRFEEAENAAKRLLSRGRLRRGDITQIHAGLGLMSVIRRDGPAARTHYAQLLPFRGLVVCPYHGLTADHLLALLAQTAGNSTGARDHFQTAAAFCRERNLALELAYTCRDYAQFLLGKADARDAALAAALCEEAGFIARRCGLPHLTRKLAELTQLVTDGSTPSPAYPDSLSEREIEVLRLLAEGLSNTSIADRLFISQYTVANHVQKILDKTGTANRTEAAMYAVRHNLLPTNMTR